MKWKEILSLLIIIGILYLLFKGLRKTRAEGGLKLLCLILIVSFFIIYLNLPWISVFLKQIWPLFIVGYIILFQPELRFAIIRLQEGYLFRRILRLNYRDTVLSELIEAIKKLSINKIGGLIVIEQGTNLDRFIATGKELDACLSSELITTIFSSNGALHDGAIIIRGNRIISVACILPLSEKSNIKDKENLLGTRHLAALGITEQTDAIAIVVSEKTGNISFAKDGKIEKEIDITQLSNKLAQALS